MKYSQNIDNRIVLSKRIFFIMLLYVFFMTTFRFLLPYGDEPDFEFKIKAILNSKSLYSHYYLFTDLLSNYKWVNIIQESFKQKLLRVCIALFITMPIFLLIIFKKNTISYNTEYQERVKALGLSLIMPSIIYYLGVLSEEQFTLVLSLLVFLFWNNKFALVVLSSIVMVVDFGNSIILITFILFFSLSEYLSKKYSIKTISFIFIIILSALYFIGIDAILSMSFIPIVCDKVVQIYEDYTTYYAYVATKYPLLLRPFMTFVTFVFMTPMKIGMYILYPIYGFFLLYALKKLILKGDKKAFIYFITPIVFVTSIVFVLPGYSNAKYYIFTMPFIIYGILKVFEFKSIFCFAIISNLAVIDLLLWNLL